MKLTHIFGTSGTDIFPDWTCRPCTTCQFNRTDRILYVSQL